MIIETKPEFQTLSEDAVLAALADPDPKNPVIAEVARLVIAYTEYYRHQIDSRVYMPVATIMDRQRWPIEAVAMRLWAAKVMRDSAKGSSEG